jgi:hypothetical protein
MNNTTEILSEATITEEVINEYVVREAILREIEYKYSQDLQMSIILRAAECAGLRTTTLVPALCPS